MSAADGAPSTALIPDPAVPAEFVSRKSLSSAGSACGRIAAVLLAPVVVFLTLLFLPLVLLSSNEFPIWRQKRVGYRGRDIKIPKFSTMNVAASGELRETWFGRLVRPVGLDEILQVFPIIVGEMQWFGPRPFLRKDLDECYIESVLSHTKPGLFNSRSLATGIGNRALQEGGIDITGMIRYDRGDLQNWSFSYASGLLLNTMVMVIKTGASMLRRGSS
jgi:lipopolysaccharide/colanic/teichoic acid biosynthesis glycosyltransferase